MKGSSVLLVGTAGGPHIASSFQRAAAQLSLETQLLDAHGAFAAPRWLTRFHWRVRGHRPPRLREFNRHTVEACRQFRPRWLLSVGFAPLDAEGLQEIGKLGVERCNYLTDDPWNRSHRAPWFFRALPHYDHVFSPRASNVDDLRSLGCGQVSYLPFAYTPELQFPEPPATPEEEARFDAELVFAGGADRDRVPYLTAFIRSGFRVALYGGYWDQLPSTRAYARGIADAQTLRKAIGGAKVALCLVRRANRDGHAMRSYELPAMGACMLTEDTEEHREIFGKEGEAVRYFRNVAEAEAKLRWLLTHEEERCGLASAAHALIVHGRNTYRDRLMTILGLNGERPWA